MPSTTYPTPASLAEARPVPRIAIVSTYPPTQCGLATFSAALARGLRTAGADVRIVRVVESSSTSSRDVQFELRVGSPGSLISAARCVNECDVAIIQHEYGLFGGDDGSDVLDIMNALQVPSIVVAHTVLRDPSPNQRAVLEAVLALANRVVVMAQGASDRLRTRFTVDPDKVVAIPHGAVVPRSRRRSPETPGPDLLTWGLLGPGKGIERVIDAMPTLRSVRGRPRYLVAGRTHPKVLAAHGEAYRNARIQQAWRMGVAQSVDFDPRYRDVPSLTALIQSATAVVLPYDSTDQVTSGVLVDAVAAGRPVIATAFPHAVELLSGGAGIVVDHDDARAMELALRRVLTDDQLAGSMAAAAEKLAPTMRWGEVAAAYLRLADELLPVRSAVL